MYLFLRSHRKQNLKTLSGLLTTEAYSDAFFFQSLELDASAAKRDVGVHVFRTVFTYK